MKEFRFAGVHTGIKKEGLKDMGIILCDRPANAAALFTKNRVKAAPVLLGEKVIQKGLCQAVLVNSGNANCFTGDQGLEDAEKSASLVSESFAVPRERVMVSSTGVIGAPLPMDKFRTGIPLLKQSLSPQGLEDFSRAILTTDTFPKIIENQVEIDGKRVHMIGIAKGSGMIRPDMATMLAYVCTNADIDSMDLKKRLILANEKSFSRITVDGDTSTNDTLLCLASGQSGVVIDSGNGKIFQEMLDKTCLELAKMVVRDGEGATKLARIVVKGAGTAEDAFRAAEAIAHSNLVKTAIYGQDPNWGRITAAAGRSGARVDPDLMDLYFEDVALVVKGKWQGREAEAKASEIMKKEEITMTLDLNLGQESDGFLFCDFSEGYVKINADYRT
ncbi:bifunctional glutamate N-acetyltransferase/amino-acid acetyltransferase ArgJ [Desulfospira joergensenii]|uniref:bifunctional glutamate N-acetyltransferase/amino-acid acetyltransferase ArgJ n=1 Tax=Desulfospira joergensenii TaxID=53329 RepID=UPI0003B509BC|nr:bifunctional glutamate N-acetyltransferase/amino-acid acetyltransferase ArgJ [Desulfospira joergensenii]